MQEYPIKEQELKFPSFLCFGWFSDSLFYTLLAETQDKKTMGNKTLKVKITRKIKFPRFLSFWFWPIPEIENLEILRKFSFTTIFRSIRNSKFKDQINDFKQEKCSFKMKFNKTKKISEVFKFSIHISESFRLL